MPRKGPSIHTNKKIPEFQALPSSITSQQLVQPTKIEYYPKENIPEVDLKGHTVEELSAIAGVSEEYIRTAIKMKQQQMMKEKHVTSLSTMKTTFPLQTSTTPANINDVSITTENIIVTPSYKLIDQKKELSKQLVHKKKTMAKKVVKYGQKVRNNYIYLILTFFYN